MKFVDAVMKLDVRYVQERNDYGVCLYTLTVAIIINNSMLLQEVVIAKTIYAIQVG